MRTTPHRSAIPLRPPSPSTAVAFFAVAGLVAALATWHGSLFTAVVPVGAFVLGAALFVAVRRALRRASTLIDTILREELDRPESHPESRAAAKQNTYR